MTIVQKNLLEYWSRYEKEHNQPPTLYRAAIDLGLTGSASIQRTINRLVAKGLMTKKQVPGRMGNVYSVRQQDNQK